MTTMENLLFVFEVLPRSNPTNRLTPGLMRRVSKAPKITCRGRVGSVLGSVWAREREKGQGEGYDDEANAWTSTDVRES